MKLLTTIRKHVDKHKLEQNIKTIYRNVALNPQEQYHFATGRVLAEKLGYPMYALGRIPNKALESYTGVGYHFDLANISRGETILDLGSGSGTDAFFAALQCGPQGAVIGIDLTDVQVDKSSRFANQHGYNNVQFIENYIESIPAMAASADVVMSNGVINLSPDKARVFLEAARVLRSGGRLIISDVVSEIPIPESISTNASLWASCIGGVETVDTYLALIQNAGLTVTSTRLNPEYMFTSISAKLASLKYGIQSVTIVARKP